MTSYTVNRKYPYPSSAREAGNGGLASEALARAVARDLDVLDAGWASAAIRPTKIMGLTADTSALGPSTQWTFTWDTVLSVTGAAYFTTATNDIQIATGGAGWYYANLNWGCAPVGTVTVAARQQVWIQHLRSNGTGTLVNIGERHGDTYWPSSTPNLYNRTSGMFRMEDGDRLWVYWQHANTGSNVKVLQGGTSLEVTRVCGL